MEKGKVRKWYSYRMSGRDTIEGTGKNTIDALVRKGLVYLDYKPKQIGDFNPSDNYVLTDAGHAALEAVDRFGKVAKSK